MLIPLRKMQDINEAAAEVAEAQRVALEIKRQALHEASLREEQEQRQRRAVEEAERKSMSSARFSFDNCVANGLGNRSSAQHSSFFSARAWERY